MRRWNHISCPKIKILSLSKTYIDNLISFQEEGGHMIDVRVGIISIKVHEVLLSVAALV
jgi:hypothetical protein